MYNKIFPRPAIEAKHRKGLLGLYFDHFVAWMQDHGYSRHSIRYYVQSVTRFGQYLRQRNIRYIYQLEGVQWQKLLRDYQCYCRRQGCWYRVRGLKLYFQVLEKNEGIKIFVPKALLLFQETQEYINFLKNQRNLKESTISNHIYWAEKFLEFIGCKENTSSMPSFGITDVDRFIKQEGGHLQRSTQQLLSNILKSFLRFLYQSGKTSKELAALIISPRLYKLESLPNVLSWDEIQKILNSVDRSTKSGLRHYAILILLVTYGLRAGEVANLKLEDINWRNETIRISSRKNRKDLWLPLIPRVGKVILKYLKHGRPSSKRREIFLCTHAPWRSLNTDNISYVVNRHIQFAGLDPPRHGAHLLRHSFATFLSRKNVPLKQIGDILGHCNPVSTHIYTKTATENLQEVALEALEVK